MKNIQSYHGGLIASSQHNANSRWAGCRLSIAFALSRFFTRFNPELTYETSEK